MEIADYHMERGEWEQALPYAKAAVASGAGWAMSCLARCYEGMNQYDEAEKWIRAQAERYEQVSLPWFFWCKRTGRGDADAARRLADGYFAHRAGALAREDYANKAAIYLLCDEPNAALDTYLEIWEKQPEGRDGLMAVIVADAVKDTATRDRVLQQLVGRSNAWEKQMGPNILVTVVRLFQQYLAAGPGGQFDLKAFDKALETIQRHDTPLGCF